MEFQYPGKKSEKPVLYPNLNLVLGNNGSGKSTLLKSIAMAALGPALPDSKLIFSNFVRKAGKEENLNNQNYEAESYIQSQFVLNDQDVENPNDSGKTLTSRQLFHKRGDLELVQPMLQDANAEKLWEKIYSSGSDGFFFVGYGATRRVESLERLDPGSRKKAFFGRVLRIQSLFEDSYSLYPLSLWLPALKSENPGRYKQAANLINEFLSDTQYQFKGELEHNELIFENQSIKVAFPSLSDGFKAFLGWVGDLLYHVVSTCPKGKKLKDNQGMVLLDEVDLHLHPKWQMKILPRLSQTLPNIQFIVTSHSPLVVGSLEWINILFLKTNEATGASIVEKLAFGVHGLDADQILLSDFFGLESTRTEGKARQLKALTEKAVKGDKESAYLLLESLSKGSDFNAIQ